MLDVRKQEPTNLFLKYQCEQYWLKPGSLQGMTVNSHEDICTSERKKIKKEQNKISGLHSVNKDFVP